jgi:hypothetical protein
VNWLLENSTEKITDVSVFPTSKHLWSWACLTPQNNKSAGKKKTTRVSHAGAYVKPNISNLHSPCAYFDSSSMDDNVGDTW